MRLEKIFRIRLQHQETKHWKDMDELHDVLHNLPHYLKALLLELAERPMSKNEINNYMKQLKIRMRRHQKKRMDKADLDRDIAYTIECGLLKEQYGKFYLTPSGREITEHMQEAIPLFIGLIYSVKTVSIITITINALLSFLKLAFGFISSSTGLIADGIDNTVDTISAGFVWLGIKFNKEKITSLFIIIMMYAAVGGIAIAAYGKILNPRPIEEGLSAFIVSAVSGLIMLLLSAYQYQTGERQNNFAIMCQSVDSRNHFLTSLLVCGGIMLSYVAELFHIFWFNYADVIASIIISCLILKSAIELNIELAKSDGKSTRIPHFMKSAQERMQKKMILSWLTEQLRDEPLTKKELEKRFTKQFCKETPKIQALMGTGYRPKNSEDLHQYLDQFVDDKEIVFIKEKYSIKS